MFKKKFILAIIVLVFTLYFSNCNQYDANNYLILNDIDTTGELMSLYESDQHDRALLIDSTSGFNIKMLNKNDSIRLSRVIELDRRNQIRTNLQKYLAAFIYHHCGGEKMTNDSSYELRAGQLCKEIIDSKNDDVFKDTVLLSEFNQVLKKLSSLKEEVYKSSQIDTIYDKYSENIYIEAKTPLKVMAASLLQLIDSRKNIEKNKIKATISNIDQLNDPNFRKELKEQLKEKLIKQLKEKQPNLYKSLSDEEIDELAEKDLENFIDLIKGAIKKQTNNPGK
jgi:hypothetical protein